MANNDNTYKVELEATVLNIEDLASTCLSTPTRSISDNSETDTINIDEISIDSNEQPSGDEPYDQMEEEDGEIDIIDEKFYCAPTLQYTLSANEEPNFSENFCEYWCIPDTPDSPLSIQCECHDKALPSFWDPFWEDWYTPDTPDSPSSIGYDSDDGANAAHCLSPIVSESECGSGSECDF